MAAVATPVLWGLAADGVGGCQLPRRQIVKPAQSVFYVVFIAVLIYWNMSQSDEFFRPVFRLQWVEADFEIHCGLFCLIILFTFIIFSKMATVTVLVRHGVTNMATHSAFVLFVGLCVLCGFIVNFVVAVDTVGCILDFVSVCVVSAITVHFGSTVAFAACEIFFSMNICGDTFIFSEVLLFDATAMTSGADGFHGRLFLKQMGLQQPPPKIIGAADMALAAAAVAHVAVILPCAVHLGMFRSGRVGAHVGHLVEWRERHVEAVPSALCNLLVALTTAL